MRPERIVSKLVIIKGMLKIRRGPDAPVVPLKSTDRHDGCVFSRHATQRRVGRDRINRAGRRQVKSMSAAESNSRRIDKAGAKGVALFEHHGLPPGMRIENYVVERVGLLQIRIVE